MPTLRQIARDPRKALSELEKKLGAEPGALLQEMSAMGKPTEEWGSHLPYDVARAYCDDAQTGVAFEEHVNGCTYCRTLVETLNPTPRGLPTS
jgi:hypothetical protein